MTGSIHHHRDVDVCTRLLLPTATALVREILRVNGNVDAEYAQIVKFTFDAVGNLARELMLVGWREVLPCTGLSNDASIISPTRRKARSRRASSSVSEAIPSTPGCEQRSYGRDRTSIQNYGLSASDHLLRRRALPASQNHRRSRLVAPACCSHTRR